jgi:hypothetical protein
VLSPQRQKRSSWRHHRAWPTHRGSIVAAEPGHGQKTINPVSEHGPHPIPRMTRSASRHPRNMVLAMFRQPGGAVALGPDLTAPSSLQSLKLRDICLTQPQPEQQLPSPWHMAAYLCFVICLVPRRDMKEARLPVSCESSSDTSTSIGHPCTLHMGLLVGCRLETDKHQGAACRPELS